MNKPFTARNEFSPLERRVLLSLFASSLGNGHDFGLIEEARTAVEKPSQLGGVISSLVKKGVIRVHEAVTTDSGTWTQFEFRDVDLIPSLIKD